MKELEDRIHDTIYHKWTGDKDEICPLIAKEIKEVATSFAKYTYVESLRNVNASKDWEVLFDQFIKERYKP